ncbi:hypothetical protein CMEL01_14572 [Colletotrichum melonis]|uniref:Glycoside hydrolase family 5 domain-containing protein n=1 Tax=Colletotrichum melonis TaxID=1209925 RepID=A0AAI9UQR0_9PEZI|nr:hypothetical protein CMEL01_14572 [Colletotrichum melonis]
MKFFTSLLAVACSVAPLCAALPQARQTSWPNGPLVTNGRWAVDAAGNHIQFAGTNWPGHGEVMVPEGLQFLSVEGVVSKIKSIGMNAIRLTYAIELVDQIYANDGKDIDIKTAFINGLGETNGTAVLAQVLANNPSFTEATTRLEVYDAIAAECAKQEVYILLDNHMSTGKWCCSGNDGNTWWGDREFDAAKWVRGLTYMANHGKSWTALVAMSLRNELREATDNAELVAASYNWQDWYKYIQEGTNAINGANPGLLIFLSGLNYDTTVAPVFRGTALTPGNGTFQLSDFEGYADKLVLEIHNYEGSIGSCASLSNNLYTKGFQAMNASDPVTVNVFPVALTEFGFNMNDNTYLNTYSTCLASYLPQIQGSFFIWVLVGSYYIRQGTQNFEESWGLLNADWSEWRNPNYIEQQLKPMVAAAVITPFALRNRPINNQNGSLQVLRAGELQVRTYVTRCAPIIIPRGLDRKLGSKRLIRDIAENCRFEHPRSQNNNRFAAFGQNTGGGFNRGGNNNDGLPYALSKETIEKDLTSEAPQWILSAYGPGRDAPEQLFGGNLREQSFEEMRLVHMMAEASGNPQQALNQAQELYQQAQQQMKTAVGNLDGAIQFIISAEQTHPNRIDICKQGTSPGGTTGEFAVGRRGGASSQQNPFSSNSNTATSNPFSSSNTNTTSAFGGGGGTSTGSAFGQTATLGQRANPFGAPAFGQTSQPSQPTSAFGQPSQPTSAFGATSSSAPAFGQTSQPTSAFGQPSALGGGTSAFGQASALGQKPNPFGAPAFGQPAQPAAASGGSAFGQPSQLGGGGSTFGQASALGQKPNPFGGATSGASPFASAGSNNTSSPFGQASQNTASPSPFGQPAQNTTQNANPFGAPAQTNPSPFGQPVQPATTSAFGQPAQTASSSPFGQPSQAQPAATNPFGAKTDAQPSTFGQPAATAQPTQPASGFGQPAQLGQKTNPFGQNNASPFGQPSGGLGAGGSAPNPFGGQTAAPAPPAAQQATAPGSGPYPPGSSRQHPPVSSYSSKDMNGRLSNWKGKPVTYQGNLPGIRAFNGAWTRIWFPDGPPNYYKDTELPDELYDDKSKQQWQSFTQTGKFEGLMPELPPKREFCLWDL